MTGSGTWNSIAPSSTWTAPNGTWQFSVQISVSPMSGGTGCRSGSFTGGTAFNINFCNFTYSLNGTQVSTTPFFVEFESSSSGDAGGFILDDFEGQSNGFVLIPGTQLFTGSTTNPTISIGTFDVGSNSRCFHGWTESGAANSMSWPGPYGAPDGVVVGTSG